MTPTEPQITEAWQIENIIAATTKSSGEVSPHRLNRLRSGDALPRYFVEDWLDDAGCFDVSWKSSRDSQPPILADFRPVTVGARPSSKSIVFLGAIGVGAADFVAHLMKLHRLGINAGALAAAAALRPSIVRRKFLTSAELKILWARRELDHFDCPLVVPTSVPWGDDVVMVGNSGHTVSIVSDAEGNAVLVGHGVKPSRRKLDAQQLNAITCARRSA